MNDEMEHQPDDAENELYREVMSKVEIAGREVGLYLDKVHIGVHMPDTETTGPYEPGQDFLVMAEFKVGDLAFSPRVLNPASENTNTVVRGMDVDIHKETVEEVRKRLQDGTGPLGDLAEDD